MTPTMKATMDYASGWKLTFPATGMAPRLFLEWLEINGKQDRNGIKFTVKTDEIEEEPVFTVSLQYVIRETVTDLKDYINSNL